MKVLLVSDMECPALWEHFQPSRVQGIDLIVSCGDLKKDYLEFLVTMGNKPLFYIPGNHDSGYRTRPPEGCECIDDRVVEYQGIRILGLGGCKRYSLNEPYQYSEEEMRKRIQKLRREIRKMGGVDMIVTHAAITGYGDAPDNAHRGFDCFLDLVQEYHPTYFCHGHVHRSYGWDIPRSLECGSTTVINAFERYTLEIDEDRVRAMRESTSPAHRFRIMDRLFHG